MDGQTPFFSIQFFPVARCPLGAMCLFLSSAVLGHFSRVQLCDPMDYTGFQAPLSMGFSRQEYWSRLPYSPPGDLPDPGTDPA